MVQVCADFNTDTCSREVEGVLAAMDALSVNQGVIVTLHHSDHYVDGDKHVRILPFYEWAIKN